MMTLAAAAVEEDRGWGGIVAMVLAVALYAAIRYGVGRLRERLDGPPAKDDDEDLDDGEVLVDEPAPARAPWWRSVVAGLWDRDPEPLPSPTGEDDRDDDDQELCADGGDLGEGKWIIKRHDWGAISYPPGTRVQPARPPRRRR